jgi:hypothetical protein
LSAAEDSRARNRIEQLTADNEQRTLFVLDFAAIQKNSTAGTPVMPERGGARTRVVHQNLDTAYLNLAALVRHLQQRDFTGRVHVELDEYDADIYLAARGRPRVRAGRRGGAPWSLAS